MKITIAIDALGGDHGPQVTIPAALQVLAKYPDVHLILVGDKEVLWQPLHACKNNSRLTIQHASQQVEMNELPAHALRNKKDSSMRVAINLVDEGKADACVSAGNTGALMATARFVLKMLPGIDRPAIITLFPCVNSKKNVRILDVGANVDCTPEHLFQFALMGSILSSAVDNVPNPKVFLLNIGSETIKGNELVKQTAERLANTSFLNYVGYIEGDQIYQGEADVVVCDGFVGNSILKSIEGIAKVISRIIKEAFQQNILTKFVGLLSLPVLKSIVKRTDPDRYNGASFIGLQGIVVKSHGGAKISAFARAIEEAITQVDKQVPQRIRAELERIMTEKGEP